MNERKHQRKLSNDWLKKRQIKRWPKGVQGKRERRMSLRRRKNIRLSVLNIITLIFVWKDYLFFLNGSDQSSKPLSIETSPTLTQANQFGRKSFPKKMAYQSITKTVSTGLSSTTWENLSKSKLMINFPFPLTINCL